MSVQTLYTAATGMSALETKLDVVANNLANVETTAFKRSRANFEELLYRHLKMPGTQDSAGQYTPVGISVGLGTRVAGTQGEFAQGALQQTDRELDVAIEGRGFFQVTDPDGNIYYTRAGHLSKNANGDLVVGSAHTGRLLEPPITIPQDATAVSIGSEGIISVRQPGSQTLTQVGQVELAYFINPEGLLRLGESLFAETDASGAPILANPGQDGLGRLQQGALAASHVQPVHELIDLIKTQRAFELNSEAVKVGDEMMQAVANMRRI